VDEAGRGGAGVLHLRPSRDQVAGDLLERRALHQRHCARVDARVGRSRQCCRGVERIRASRSRCGIILTGRVVSVLLGGGAAGSACVETRRGTSASLYWRRAGLADEVGFDAMPDAAGGEAVTGSLNRKG
jgi:hypothetical protein